VRLAEALREKVEEKRLEREAPLAAIAAQVVVEADRSPLEAVSVLASLDSLPSVSEAAEGVIKKSLLSLKPLHEQLYEERRDGTWGRILSTVAYVEASGLDPRAVFKDLVKTALRDLRASYEQLSDRFQAMIRVAGVAFGAFPMMVSVMLAILASDSVIPLLLAFTLVNLVLAALWTLLADLQIPEIADYAPFYRRVLAKWLPLGAAVGAASYLGLLYLPVSLVYRSPLSLSLGALAFSLPAYLEWRLQAKVQDELLESLPLVLRGVAEQVSKGFSVHQALENVAKAGGLPRYADKLLTLILKEARIYGSLRDAYVKVRDLLPKPWRFSLELLVVAEEVGAGAGAIHSLADSVAEYVASVREFRRKTGAYKWLSLGMAALTLALLGFISHTVMARMAAIGLLAEQNPAVTLPFKPPTPDQLPALKDSIYLAAAANSLALAVVTGKTSGWRMGDALPELLKTSALLLALLVALWWA